MARLLLVRHGSTALQVAGRYCGHTDVPLSTEGLRQAECLRERLSDEGIAAAYSSDLCRAMATASIVVERRNMTVTPVAELREINFGLFEGRTLREIEADDPDAARFWSADRGGPAFPEGESIAALVARVETVMAKLKGHAPDDTVLVVAHKGPLSVLICLLLGMDPLEWWRLSLDCGSLSLIETYANSAVIRLLNDVCHLEPRTGR